VGTLRRAASGCDRNVQPPPVAAAGHRANRRRLDDNPAPTPYRGASKGGELELILALILGAVAAALVRRVLRERVLANVEAQVATEVTTADFRLQGARWCEFEIVGENDRQAALIATAGRDPNGVQHHCEAILIPEPQNPFEPNAILVAINGHPVGHLARDDALEYTERLGELGRAGQTASCPAYIFGGFVDEDGEQAEYSVKLGLAWPIALEGPQEHGPEVSIATVARLRGRLLSEEDAWHTPPVEVADEAELAESFPAGVGGREIAFVGWSDERLPYLQAVSKAAGLRVEDPPTPDLALICVGPRTHEHNVASARSQGVAIVSGEQLQQLMS